MGDNFTWFTNKIIECNKDKILKAASNLGFEKMVIKSYTEFSVRIKPFGLDENESDVEISRILGKPFEPKDYPFSRFVPVIFDTIKNFIDLTICTLGDAVGLDEALFKQTTRVAADMCYAWQEALGTSGNELLVFQRAILENDLTVVLDHFKFIETYLETRCRSTSGEPGASSGPTRRRIEARSHYEQFKLRNSEVLYRETEERMAKAAMEWLVFPWAPKEKGPLPTEGAQKIVTKFMENLAPVLNWNKELVQPLLLMAYKSVSKEIWESLLKAKAINTLGIYVLSKDLELIIGMTSQIMIDFPGHMVDSKTSPFSL